MQSSKYSRKLCALGDTTLTAKTLRHEIVRHKTVMNCFISDETLKARVSLLENELSVSGRLEHLQMTFDLMASSRKGLLYLRQNYPMPSAKVFPENHIPDMAELLARAYENPLSRGCALVGLVKGAEHHLERLDVKHGYLRELNVHFLHVLARDLREALTTSRVKEVTPLIRV